MSRLCSLEQVMVEVQLGGDIRPFPRVCPLQEGAHLVNPIPYLTLRIQSGVRRGLRFLPSPIFEI